MPASERTGGVRNHYGLARKIGQFFAEGAGCESTLGGAKTATPTDYQCIPGGRFAKFAPTRCTGE